MVSGFRKYLIIIIALFCCFAAGILTPALAEGDETFDVAWQAAKRAAIKGPADVRLADRATLHLPAGYLFIPQAPAIALSKAIGNDAEPDQLYGMVTSINDDEDWFAYVEYFDDGYVKDTDAKNWNRNELFQSLKEGTEEENKFRIEKGIAPIELVRWIEPPAYDDQTHRLVWSVLLREKGEAEGDDTVNYNTYVLGRTGHFELNLVGDLQTVEASKEDMASILAALEYDAGKRYEDYDPATDATAEYGLEALIGGVAKQLGIAP